MQVDEEKKITEKTERRCLEVIGWLIGVVGILSSIFGATKTEANGFGAVFLIMLVTELVLVVMWAYCLVLKWQYKSDINGYEQHIQLLHKENEEYIVQIQDEKQHYQDRNEEVQKIVSSISSNFKNLCKTHNEFLAKIPSIIDKSLSILDVMERGKVEDDNLIRGEIVRAQKEFRGTIYSEYKRYTRNFLDAVVGIQQAQLDLKGIKKEVSVTVKLFDTPYYPNSSRRENIVVYTAFRDKRTYDIGDREVGEKVFCIDENSDFTYCLRRDYFIMNNLQRDSSNYSNENKEFFTHYNCTVVVPIRAKVHNQPYRYFGYLCCDCLNESDDEVFDKKSAQFLFSMAQIYATYLDALDVSFQDRKSELDDNQENIFEIIKAQTIDMKIIKGE